MAQVDADHLAPLTIGWVVLLVGTLLALGALNHYANK